LSLVKADAYPFARERIAELIESAHAAVGQIQPRQLDRDTAGFFKATWTTSRAAGFLEAFALVDPALAREMLPDFESVAQLVDRLQAAGHPVADRLVAPLGAATSERAPTTDRRIASRPEGNVRRVAVRRSISERRTTVRRQLSDRRGI
jgi:hypothetical protein